jgi:hypothetical protein
MDEQPLRQLLKDDLPSLRTYYQEMATEQGSGVLVVNYYPSGEIAQMEAKFLKSSQIPRLARQMGLPTLQVEFEKHNPQNQMVVALVTAETKGVVTVEMRSPEPEKPEPQSRQSQTKRRSSTATTKSKSGAKPTTRRKTTSKPTTRRKKQSEE